MNDYSARKQNETTPFVALGYTKRRLHLVDRVRKRKTNITDIT